MEMVCHKSQFRGLWLHPNVSSAWSDVGQASDSGWGSKDLVLLAEGTCCMLV